MSANNQRKLVLYQGNIYGVTVNDFPLGKQKKDYLLNQFNTYPSLQTYSSEGYPNLDLAERVMNFNIEKEAFYSSIKGSLKELGLPFLPLNQVITAKNLCKTLEIHSIKSKSVNRHSFYFSFILPKNNKPVYKSGITIDAIESRLQAVTGKNEVNVVIFKIENMSKNKAKEIESIPNKNTRILRAKIENQNEVTSGKNECYKINSLNILLLSHLLLSIPEVEPSRSKILRCLTVFLKLLTPVIIYRYNEWNLKQKFNMC
ncbi:MAG: hypothetical protein ACI9EK_001226 [Psychroserpens sp.]|jgi:hypothetical protein